MDEPDMNGNPATDSTWSSTGSRTGFLACPRPVHFVGIGGSGMAPLAECLLRSGFAVSGSDAVASTALIRLQGLGARVAVGHAEANVPGDAALVVRTLAVPETNPELVQARDRGVPVIRYAELLGMVMADRTGVAVSGCHGKTTTTGMIAFVLDRRGADPSYVVGGVLPWAGSGSRMGNGPHFVAEACEYARSFHCLRPRVAVVTNVEADHLDYYRDLEEIVASFAEFLTLVPREGRWVVNADDADAMRAAREAKRRRGSDAARQVTFGRDPGCDWRIEDPRIEEGEARAGLSAPGGTRVQLHLGIPGVHNLWNAAAAVAALAQVSIPPADAAETLRAFPGVERRMQRLAVRDGCILMDDYAHHPTEVDAVLQAARRIPGVLRVVAIFQPHQHGRVRRHLAEFGKVLGLADLTLVPNIYSARETAEEVRSVSADDLVREVRRQGGEAEHAPDFAALVERAQREAAPGTLIVTMGAGDVWKAAHAIRSAWLDL